MTKLYWARISEWRDAAHLRFQREFRSSEMARWQEQEQRERLDRRRRVAELGDAIREAVHADAANVERDRIYRLKELIQRHGFATVENVLHAKLPDDLRPEGDEPS